ncbi:MAG: nucleoside monophosphate kinase [Verrucomicrobia bacterium]|nr:nucleoside monophosphate kinase [Verrucomicrobiota bacterium]
MSIPIIIFLGPPGCGKGTHAKLLAERAGAGHFDLGSLLRGIAKSGSPRGVELTGFMSKGLLVPDTLIIEIVRDALSERVKTNPPPALLLDGFPRTVAQAEALEKVAASIELGPVSVININLPNELIVERIANRRVCNKCGAIFDVLEFSGKECPKCKSGQLIQRDDDKAEVVRRRLEEYAAKTAPLLQFYGKKGKLVSVVSDAPVEVVRERVYGAYKQIQPK